MLRSPVSLITPPCVSIHEMSLSRDCVNFGPPFDDSDADIILRSGFTSVPIPGSTENRVVATDFLVHKILLIKASSIFKSLLSSKFRNPGSTECSSQYQARYQGQSSRIMPSRRPRHPPSYPHGHLPNRHCLPTNTRNDDQDFRSHEEIWHALCSSPVPNILQPCGSRCNLRERFPCVMCLHQMKV
ncbi:hypothetical protein H4582DRAFT_1383699 [Lactarius indigo]|nr:hypothetical protein H4582DRAFT_1383699 [Lactarius indigo]